MKPSLPGLFDRMRRTLRADVLPEVGSDHARSQLAGVLDILAKLETMTSWSPDMLVEQHAAATRGCAAFAREAAPFGFPPPAAAPGAAVVVNDVASLERALREAEAELVRCTDWLFDAAHLPPEAAAALDARLRDTGRDLLVAERRRIPRADFGAMTSGAAERT